MSKKINTAVVTEAQIYSAAKKAGKAKKSEKAAILAEEAMELEGQEVAQEAQAFEASKAPSEIVIEAKVEETQTSTPAPETLATESETDQAKAEREYGEAALNDLLATPGFLATFRSTSGLEPAVAEAIYRRLTKGTAKPIVTKSTFKATEGGVGPTKRVWEIAAEMKGCRRSEVLERCLAEGIGINTAKTQYQKFMEAGKGKITGAKTV